MEFDQKGRLKIGEKRVYGDATVEGRSGDVMAYVTGQKTQWESGRSIKESLQKLRVSRPGLNIPSGE